MQRKKNSKKVSRKPKLHLQPPQLNNLQLHHSTKLRFQTAVAYNNAITTQNLLDCIIFATTSTVGFDVFKTVKIRQVEVWSGATTAAVPTTVTVIFNGGTTFQGGDQVVHSDTVVGTARAAHVVARPQKGTYLSQYLISDAGNSAFSLNVPANAIVDVSLSFKGFDLVSPGPIMAVNALVAATAGVVYWRGLDGAAIASTVFVPIGVPTK